MHKVTAAVIFHPTHPLILGQNSLCKRILLPVDYAARHPEAVLLHTFSAKGVAQAQVHLIGCACLTVCWGPVTADKCYRSIFQFFTKHVKTGRSSLTSSYWCIVPHSNTVFVCFLLNWLCQAIDWDYNLYVDMSKEILIPDEVDIVLGFMYVGGGSGLSRIAPEGQWQDSRRQGILRIICESKQNKSDGKKSIFIKLYETLSIDSNVLLKN